MDITLGAKQRTDKPGFPYSGRSYRAKKLNPYTILITKILRLGAIRLSFLSALILLSLPSLISTMRSAASSGGAPDSDPSSISTNYFKMLPILCHDLIDEGLIRKGHKGLIVGTGPTHVDDDYIFLKDTGVNLMTVAGLQEEEEEKRAPVENNDVFDFVFTPRFSGIKTIDRVVKNGGMAITPLSNNLMHELHELNNYRIVYLRIFKNTVVAMRKQPDQPERGVLRALKNGYLGGLRAPVTAGWV